MKVAILKIVLPLFIFGALVLNCPGQESYIHGLSFVAPPQPFTSDPMQDVLDVNANWISVIPFAYTRIGRPHVSHDESSYQWWGERPEGVKKTIHLAHEKGIKIMLKPQVYIPGSWPGGLTFDKEEDWTTWEASYREYILRYATMAEELSVEMFCVGTEFRESVRQRSSFWKKLITDVRGMYTGSITYAANWDDFDDIDFWDQLDFIGIDAYFPISEETTPTKTTVEQGWHSIMPRIQKFSKERGRKVLFTEYGYLSVDGAAGKTWELEKNVKSRSINELAQANALDGLLSACMRYECWAGGFLWKWFPHGQGHEGYPERDYTPQGKLGAEIIKRNFAQRK